jgi:hypothetical protein
VACSIEPSVYSPDLKRERMFITSLKSPTADRRKCFAYALGPLLGALSPLHPQAPRRLILEIFHRVGFYKRFHFGVECSDAPKILCIMYRMEVGLDGMRWGLVTNGAGKGLEATHPLVPALRFVRA